MSYRNSYRDYKRQSHGVKQQWVLTAKDALFMLAILMTSGAGYFWWYIQSALTNFQAMAILLAIGMAIAPPALTAFLIPWSPARTLLAKILGKTFGGAATIAMVLYLLYYATMLLYNWWVSTGNVPEYALFQTILCHIFFIFIPALLWTPTLAGDLLSIIKEEHLVRQYEIQTQGQIMQMRKTLMRAQVLTLKGFANLTTGEKEELAGMHIALVKGIERNFKEISAVISEFAGTAVSFDDTLEDNGDVRQLMYSIADSIAGVIEAPKDDEDDTENTCDTIAMDTVKVKAQSER